MNKQTRVLERGTICEQARKKKGEECPDSSWNFGQYFIIIYRWKPEVCAFLQALSKGIDFYISTATYSVCPRAET